MESKLPTLPKKLKKDAIAEAICEIRFECEESLSLPEIVIGRLADFDAWRDFEKFRLPVSDIPASIRSQDPNLKKQPVVELRERNGSRLAKIGVNILSYHRLAPYTGWESFKPEIDRTIEFLFGLFQSFKATRLGFRYVNVFTAEDHGVNDVRHLNYSVNLAGDDLQDPQNLNYRKVRSDVHSVQVRIASPEFVSGPIAKKVQVLVDLDVFTPDGFETNEAETAKAWVEDAHTYEKEEFFRLFTDEMKQRLVEAE